MAGLQSCCRKLIVSGHLHILKKSSYILNTSRSRHCLAFRLRFGEKQQFNEKHQAFKTYLRYSIRLSSTDVPKQDVVVEKVIENAPPVPGAASSAANDIVSQTSSTQIVIDEASLPPIPTVEEPTQLVLEFVSTGLKEPSFKSLGLGSYWPSGIIQQILEFLHINLDLPWWGAIMSVTLVLRLLVFPLSLKAKRNAVRFSNNMPEFQRLQMKISEARETGNYYDVSLYTLELQNFLKEKGIFTFSSFIPALVQGPIFLSVYFGLKGMAQIPVESLKTGGLFWFQDLTLPDPYFILPIVTSTSLFAMIKVGAEGTDVNMMNNSPVMKYGLTALPLIIFPFIYNLPEIILWYWTVSNFISLAQVGLLKIPAVAKACNIPKIVKSSQRPVLNKKGFLKGFREGMDNLKVIKELEDRERVNSMSFKEAGKVPVQRTFKRNPQLRKAQS